MLFNNYMHFMKKNVVPLNFPNEIYGPLLPGVLAKDVTIRNAYFSKLHDGSSNWHFEMYLEPSIENNIFY